MDLLFSIIEFLTDHFTVYGHRTYWVFLLSALGLAFFVYVQQAQKAWSIRGFLGYVFPKSVWLHRSALVDYKYFAANAVVMLLIFTPLIALVYPQVLAFFLESLGRIGVPEFVSAPKGVGLIYFVVFILVTDFMIFLGHYLSHKVPFFWQFHKVHHAAEVLNPMTLYRQHPMDLVLNGVLLGIGTAFVHALFTHMFSSPFSIGTIGALNGVLLAFYLLGYNLRHSHIRMSFGRKLEHWFISPVQHQLHHSSIEKHFDKNMGLIFAVWDRLFGTLYIPAKDEEIILGLPNGEAAEFNSAFKCYVLPFKKAFGSHKLATAVTAASVLGLSTVSMAGTDVAPPSLHLEELTWNEVDAALKSGYTSVIIPTGGTEQNGRHVTLGKHNHVVRYTAEETANGLGDTLIAPVMTYVPEGEIDRTGHMAFAGTISIREEAFEMILEDTAKSLFSHGFTHIYVMGDSGDSVDAQQRAVDAVKDELEPGQAILHVSDYYSGHGQVEWLKSQGYSEASIGFHAGIRDTSELLAVSPKDVRKTGLRQTSQDQGATGAYWKASADIGETMLRLKIDAAIAQIEAFNAPKMSANPEMTQP